MELSSKPERDYCLGKKGVVEDWKAVWKEVLLASTPAARLVRS